MASTFPNTLGIISSRPLRQETPEDAPASTHFAYAQKVVRAGKAVLVEKPLAETADKCRQLIEEAERPHQLLMVDHTFPCAAVRKIKSLIQHGLQGKLHYL